MAANFLVLAGDVVPKKKPAPDIYLLALEKLGLPTADCLVIEDSHNGLLAAEAAGIRCVVTLSSYTWEEDMSGAVLVVSDFGEPDAPMQIVANRSHANPGPYVTMKDLQACLQP
jgi:beta-phosphoglucomutase-like phosphatase (HAD superfamily)